MHVLDCVAYSACCENAHCAVVVGELDFGICEHEVADRSLLCEVAEEAYACLRAVDVEVVDSMTSAVEVACESIDWCPCVVNNIEVGEVDVVHHLVESLRIVLHSDEVARSSYEVRVLLSAVAAVVILLERELEELKIILVAGLVVVLYVELLACSSSVVATCSCSHALVRACEGADSVSVLVSDNEYVAELASLLVSNLCLVAEFELVVGIEQVRVEIVVRERHAEVLCLRSEVECGVVVYCEILIDPCHACDDIALAIVAAVTELHEILVVVCASVAVHDGADEVALNLCRHNHSLLARWKVDDAQLL